MLFRSAVFANAINGRIQNDLKISEAVSIPLTFLLLLFVFGAMAASAMPLIVGGTLVNVSPLVSSGVAFIDFADLSFTGVTLTAAGCLIYNTSNSNAVVAVLDFGADTTATAGTFTIQFPAATTSAAILRIS